MTLGPVAMSKSAFPEKAGARTPTALLETKSMSQSGSDGNQFDGPKYRDEAWLREQYVGRGKTTYDIANECDCAASTVATWLHKNGIEVRDGGEEIADKRLTDPAWLELQYVEKGRTTVDIGDLCGCSHRTVSRWLERHDIETRDSGSPCPDERLKNSEWLREQYADEERTIHNVAKTCSCSPSTVREWLLRHGIETRDVAGENHPEYQGGPREYGRGWSQRKRRRVRERDGNECVACGLGQTEHRERYAQSLHVHHLIKARDIDDPKKRNAMENLITLCRDCHVKWERLSEAGIRPQVDGVIAD